jgi:hypothetical protein
MDMMMTVHGISTHPVEVPVQYNGEEASAMLPQLVVELADYTGLHGALALRFRSQSDIKAAKDLFVRGSTVTLTFSKGKDAPAVIDTAADEVQPEAMPA